MAHVSKDALLEAMAPGVATATAICESVGKELAGEPAETVHAELVKRLQAEPFTWDDARLQEIATAISEEPAASSGSNGEQQAEEGAPASEKADSAT
jgi:hypothetical protein